MVLVLLPSKVSRDDVAGFCTFFPQKVPNFVMPPPTSSRLTETGLFAGAHAPEAFTLAGFCSASGGVVHAKRGGKDASGPSRKHRSLRSPQGGLRQQKRQQRPAGCRAANNPRRSNPAAQADPKGWGERSTKKDPLSPDCDDATKRPPAGEDRGMFHVLSVTKSTKRPCKTQALLADAGQIASAFRYCSLKMRIATSRIVVSSAT